MASTRKFRFGLLNLGAARGDWQDFARKAEDLGYSTLAAQDHFGEQLSPLPALMSAAAVTSRIRLGTIVLDNDFRHPAVLAKDAASIDTLTDGRLELGLGAGWVQADYEKAGLSYDPGPERVSRLIESVRIIKAFFTGEPVTFHGKHYHIENLDAFPKTVQQPRPPIMIGGRQKRMLTFAAREADIVSVSMLDPRTPDGPKPPTFVEKMSWVREAAGARFGEIEIHANASNFNLTDNRKDALDALAARLYATVDEVLEMPATLVGSVDTVVETLQAWRERCDVSYFVLQRQHIDRFAPVVARLAGT